MLLSKMKNPEKCKHKKRALEKIRTIESSKPFHLLDDEEIEKSEGEEQKVILCLDCGRELERS